MKKIILQVLLLGFCSNFYGQQLETQTRDNAGEYGANIKSGFFQTVKPINYPPGATKWWHLLDIRHTNPINNHTMQFSGSFRDQELWFRKTVNNGSQPWSKILMEDSNGRVNIGNKIGFDKLTITGRHGDSTILLQADNDGNPNAYLSLWASEPVSTYSGVGIANNIRNYEGSKTFVRINNTQGGSYIRLLENEMKFNLVDNGGNLKTPLVLAGNGQVNFSYAAVAPIFMSSVSSNEGGVLSLANYSKTGSTVNDWRIYNMTGGYGNSLQFWSYSQDGTANRSRLKLSDNGNMALYGKLEATEIKVTTSPTADFVFEEDYKLPRLEEVEEHIKAKKHLPEIASAKEMEKEGVNIGEFQIKLLQKIEELTLYSIEQNKQLKQQNEDINNLKLELKSLKNLK